MRRSLPLIASLILLPSPALTLVACAAVNPALEEPSKQQVASKTTITQNANQSAPELAPEAQQYLQELTQAITVKISSSNNSGSGVLIGREGKEYLILTNAHVVRGGETFEIQTSDGQVHPGSLVQDANNSNDDLALVKFSSSQEYETATISTVPLETEILTYAGGYASKTGTLVTKTGKISQYPDKSLKEGYRIGFTSDIEQGMSGGPILDAVEGELIGINGQGVYPILNTPYVYQDGTTPSQSEIETMRQLSWGIPINTFLAQVSSDILTAYKLPLPETQDKVETTYTGWIRELEEKAQQITVRIDSSSGENGSGVIIAKEGNTYTVLTADHVICEKDPGDFSKDCPDHIYEIVTHNGNKYSLDKATFTRQEGIDLATLQFTSNEIYQVAQLANYPLNNNDAVFVAGYPKQGNTAPKWLFSLGYGLSKERGLYNLLNKGLYNNNSLPDHNPGSLVSGYEMAYTSITYGGMSGGAVLDKNGRVIGIHGLSEGVSNLENSAGVKSSIHLGNSFGIPINTFIGLVDRFKVNGRIIIEEDRSDKLNSVELEAFKNGILGTTIPDSNATPEIWLERGNKLLRLRRYDEAIKAFDNVIVQDPEFIHLAHYGKGLAFFYKRDLETALTSLELATGIKPKFVPALITKGEVLGEFKNEISGEYTRLDEGLEAIEKAIEIEPENANFHYYKSTFLVDAKRFADAIIALDRAIIINPLSTFFLVRGIILYRDIGKTQLALDDVNQAIKLNPSNSRSYNTRGIIYQDEKQYDLALNDFNRAIEINPSDDIFYYNRGDLYHNTEQYDLSLNDLNKAVELAPNDAYNYHSRAGLYRYQGKYSLALNDLEKAIELAPNDAIFYKDRGRTYREKGEYDLALADFNKSIQVNPHHAQTYFHRGISYLYLKQNDLALNDFNQALKIEPDDIVEDDYRSELHKQRGNLYIQRGEIDLAFADYNRAVELNSQDSDLFNNRAFIYKTKGKIDLALADYNQAIELNAQYAEAYYGRGVLYWQEQELNLALADYNQAIELNSQYAEAYYGRGIIYKRIGDVSRSKADLQKAYTIAISQGNNTLVQQIVNSFNQLP